MKVVVTGSVILHFTGFVIVYGFVNDEVRNR